VSIDGYSQLAHGGVAASPNTLVTGDNAVILIRLDAHSAITPTLRLGTGSNGSSVQGLAFVNGTSTVLDLASNNNVIAGNFIGVDTDGATFVG